MDKDSSASAVELAADVESRFFERSEGELNDDALKSELRELLNNISATLEVADEFRVVEVLNVASEPSPWVASSSVALVDKTEPPTETSSNPWLLLTSAPACA